MGVNGVFGRALRHNVGDEREIEAFNVHNAGGLSFGEEEHAVDSTTERSSPHSTKNGA